MSGRATRRMEDGRAIMAAATARPLDDLGGAETEVAVGDVTVPGEELAALRATLDATGEAVRGLGADVKAMAAAVQRLEANIPTRAEMAGADDRRVGADEYREAVAGINRRLDRLEQGWQRALPWASLGVALWAALASRLH